MTATQFKSNLLTINMSSQEVSTNNHGWEDVPQPNELVGGGQDLSVPEAVEETLQKKDVEINLLRKQITEYERERREMLKGFNLARFVIKKLKLIAPEVSTLEQQIVERIICFICTVHLDDWDSFYSGRTEEVTNEISMEIDNISDKEGASDPPSPVCSVCGKCCWDPHNR